MSEEDKIEKVARAICNGDPDHMLPKGRWSEDGLAVTFDGLLQPMWKSYEEPAKRALEALGVAR